MAKRSKTFISAVKESKYDFQKNAKKIFISADKGGKYGFERLLKTSVLAFWSE